jgi:tetratricopeptide (TPR) repeat protein
VRLEGAVAAYRTALDEGMRNLQPLKWATTQNNLGGALFRLGEWEGGTARLQEAVAAYRASLEERTRDRVPLDWARTQMNLGNALSVWSEWEGGTARLEEAAAAYDAALAGFVQAQADDYVAPWRANRDWVLLQLARRTRRPRV